MKEIPITLYQKHLRIMEKHGAQCVGEVVLALLHMDDEFSFSRPEYAAYYDMIADAVRENRDKYIDRCEKNRRNAQKKNYSDQSQTNANECNRSGTIGNDGTAIPITTPTTTTNTRTSFLLEQRSEPELVTEDEIRSICLQYGFSAINPDEAYQYMKKTGFKKKDGTKITKDSLIGYLRWYHEKITGKAGNKGSQKAAMVTGRDYDWEQLERELLLAQQHG